ncbi:MAG: homoserine dehydrogenase [Anaerolineales bacterium]|nr:homoserine dehydrogenase [Anaerolineales bacterium]MCS7248234.1 homoserine dehydrogenase [Anaerolineales bacterium]MDW8162047.1 homoserine dehydrogenase [Anaerolineales bacterium]MDW8447503.1 homoserine dehydrogenase [Anaerolineales bacterium]
MQSVRLLMIGLGNVGQGLLTILIEQEQSLRQYGLNFSVVGVNDLRLGSLADPRGLSLPDLLAAAAQGDLNRVAAEKKGLSVEDMLEQVDYDVLVEASYTNLQSGEPATGYIRKAVSSRKHVVTTNKGPIALHYPELQSLAEQNGVRIGFEGTVMSGTPAIFLGMNWLKAAGIQRIQGILNGTTNFILTKMEEGMEYAEALAEAQRLGYAEADPTGDVEGYDAAGKVVILSNVLMGHSIAMGEVDRQGITHLTSADIRDAQRAGQRWKLIGTIEAVEGTIRASVKPRMLPLSHPLAQVMGATNAITYTTRYLGEVTLIGAGAGRLQTGYALLADLLSIYRRESS